ncbi:MAG: CAP domain-containing protein [Fibrobacterales bacterium]
MIKVNGYYLLVGLLLWGCDVAGLQAKESQRPSDGDPYKDARLLCVQKINSWRATEDKDAYARWEDGEACADRASQKEFVEGQSHVSFGDCGEWAQNLCPGWGTLDGVLGGCLLNMWNEGPGEPFSKHGHYLNMSNSTYTKVACGFYTDPNGKVWHVQNFK